MPKTLPIKLSKDDSSLLMLQHEDDGSDFAVLRDGAFGFLFEGHRIDYLPRDPEVAVEMMKRVKRRDGKLLRGSITTTEHGLVSNISKDALWKFNDDEGLFEVGTCFSYIRESIKDAAKREAKRPTKRRKVEIDLDAETDDEDYDATERLFESKGSMIPLNEPTPTEAEIAEASRRLAAFVGDATLEVARESNEKVKARIKKTFEAARAVETD